jgi:hypothetical protein
MMTDGLPKGQINVKMRGHYATSFATP